MQKVLRPRSTHSRRATVLRCSRQRVPVALQAGLDGAKTLRVGRKGSKGYMEGVVAGKWFLPGTFVDGRFLHGIFLGARFLPGLVLNHVFVPGLPTASGFFPGIFFGNEFVPGIIQAGHFTPGLVHRGRFAPGILREDGFSPGVYTSEGKFLPGVFDGNRFEPAPLSDADTGSVSLDELRGEVSLAGRAEASEATSGLVGGLPILGVALYANGPDSRYLTGGGVSNRGVILGGLADRPIVVYHREIGPEMPGLEDDLIAPYRTGQEGLGGLAGMDLIGAPFAAGSDPNLGGVLADLLYGSGMGPDTGRMLDKINEMIGGDYAESLGKDGMSLVAGGGSGGGQGDQNFVGAMLKSGLAGAVGGAAGGFVSGGIIGFAVGAATGFLVGIVSFFATEAKEAISGSDAQKEGGQEGKEQKQEKEGEQTTDGTEKKEGNDGEDDTGEDEEEEKGAGTTGGGTKVDRDEYGGDPNAPSGHAIKRPRLTIEIPADRFLEVVETDVGKIVVVTNFDALAQLVKLTWEDRGYLEGEGQVGGMNWIGLTGEKPVLVEDPVEAMADYFWHEAMDPVINPSY